jgi:hypothetical protein
VIWRRETSVLFAVCLIAACARALPPKPEIPSSVSPGWKLSFYDKSSPPPEIPADGSPQCWKGAYTAEGTADIWICGYKERASAFEATQRVRAEAQTVKFQKDRYLILVKWNNVSRVSLTALIRAIEKSLQTAS